MLEKNVKEQGVIMNLKDLLGNDYKEDMTLEDINKALKGKDLVDRPDMSQYVSKEKYDTASKDASDWKKKYRSTLDEAEQQRIATEEANAKQLEELNSLRREVAVTKYETKLMENGYDSKLAKSTAQAMYDGDMDTVFKNQAVFAESIRTAITKETLSKTPIPPGSNGTDPISKDVKSMSLDELQAMYSEDPSSIK